MSIYVVATLKVLDPSSMEAYGKIVFPLMPKYDGEYLARTAPYG